MSDWPFAFRCRRSGNCCSIPGGIVRVTADEAVAIAGHLSLSVAAFVTRYLHVDRSRLREGLDHRCVFLADGAETRCQIYPVRPERCRTWPFWPELREDRDALRRAAITCPGIELDDEDCRS